MYYYNNNNEIDDAAGGGGIAVLAIIGIVLCALVYGTIAVLIIFSPFFFFNTFAKAIINLFGFKTQGYGLFRINSYCCNAKLNGSRHTFIMSLIHLFFSCFFFCVFVGFIRGIKELWFSLRETYPVMLEEYKATLQLTELELFFKTIWNTCVFSFGNMMDECFDVIRGFLGKFMSYYIFLSQKYLGVLLSEKFWNYFLHFVISTVAYYVAGNILYIFMIPFYCLEWFLYSFFKKRKKKKYSVQSFY